MNNSPKCGASDDLDEGLAQADRGEFASEVGVAALWKLYAVWSSASRMVGHRVAARLGAMPTVRELRRVL